jgi:CRISPR-associated protein Cas2
MMSWYRMGYLLVIFDLPVKKRLEAREASQFRKFLLDDGYLMLQYSVYMRPCVSQDHMHKHTERLRRVAPQSGFVKILFFTDLQWGKSIDIFGRPSSFQWGKRVRDEAVPEMMLFW